MNNCSENLEKLFDGMYKLKSKLTQPKFDAEVAYSTKKGAMNFQYATLKAIEEAIRKAAQESESGIMCFLVVKQYKQSKNTKKS